MSGYRLRQNTILRAATRPLPPPTPEWKLLRALRSCDMHCHRRRAAPAPSEAIGPTRLDITATDLPKMRVAFPLLISNTVHWLAGATMRNR